MVQAFPAAAVKQMDGLCDYDSDIYLAGFAAAAASDAALFARAEQIKSAISRPGQFRSRQPCITLAVFEGSSHERPTRPL